jgi:hypothetical protein
MKLIITVNFDPGDVPHIRERVTNMRGKVGDLIPHLIRLQLEDNLYFTPESHGLDPATFRPAKVGRITTRLER